MGAAVKTMKGRRRRRASQPSYPSKRAPESPMDRAKAHELNWPNVTPTFNAGRRIEDPCFVYVISECADGPVKIGLAKDPIKRLRAMQTGNSRRLRIEFVLFGERQLERLLHEMWEPHALRSPDRANKVVTGPGTEWFKGDVRETLFDVLGTAADDQLVYLQEEAEPSYQGLIATVYRAHLRSGIQVHERDEVLLLGAIAGTVTRNQSLVKFFRDPELHAA